MFVRSPVQMYILEVVGTPKSSCQLLAGMSSRPRAAAAMRRQRQQQRSDQLHNAQTIHAVGTETKYVDIELQLPAINIVTYRDLSRTTGIQRRHVGITRLRYFCRALRKQARTATRKTFTQKLEFQYPSAHSQACFAVARRLLFRAVFCDWRRPAAAQVIASQPHTYLPTPHQQQLAVFSGRTTTFFARRAAAPRHRCRRRRRRRFREERTCPRHDDEEIAATCIRIVQPKSRSIEPQKKQLGAQFRDKKPITTLRQCCKFLQYVPT